jgi:hypothetical protein
VHYRLPKDEGGLYGDLKKRLPDLKLVDAPVKRAIAHLKRIPDAVSSQTFLV